MIKYEDIITKIERELEATFDKFTKTEEFSSYNDRFQTYDVMGAMENGKGIY